MFFAQHVAFLVRILVRECKKSKKVKKPFVFPEKNFSNTKMKNKQIENLIFKSKNAKTQRPARTTRQQDHHPAKTPR